MRELTGELFLCCFKVNTWVFNRGEGDCEVRKFYKRKSRIISKGEQGNTEKSKINQICKNWDKPWIFLKWRWSENNGNTVANVRSFGNNGRSKIGRGKYCWVLEMGMAGIDVKLMWLIINLMWNQFLMLCNASGLVSCGFWLTVLCGTGVAMK